MNAQDSIFVKMLLPQKPFAVKEVLSVEIPAVEGPYLVLARRAPAIKLLKNGVVILENADKTKIEKYFISSGVAKIRDNACSILTRDVLNVAETDAEKIKKELAVYREKESKQSTLDAIDREKAAFLQMIVGYFEK